MRLKKWVILCIILGSVQGVLFAATYQDISELGTSAGMIGRGNVGGFSAAACGLLENPVGMSHAGNSVSTFYTQLFGDIDYVTGAVSYKVTPEITLGLGAIVEINPNNDITSTNNANEVVSNGTFTAYTSQAILGADFKLTKDINLGLTWTQYTRRQSDLEGSGGDLGLGLRYASNVGEFVLYGKNILGQKMTYNTGASEKFAPETGLSYKSNPIPELQQSEIFGQVRYLSDDNIIMKGIGIRVFPFENPYLGLTLGYKDKQQAGSAMRSLLSAGVSLSLGDLTFDYAYDTTDVYQQENQHYFSLSLKFPIDEQVTHRAEPLIQTNAVAPKTITAVIPEEKKTVAVLPAPKTAPVQLEKSVPKPIQTASVTAVSQPIPSVVPIKDEILVIADAEPRAIEIKQPRPIKKVTPTPKQKLILPALPKPAIVAEPAVETMPIVQSIATVTPPPKPAPETSVLQTISKVIATIATGIWNVISGVWGWFVG